MIRMGYVLRDDAIEAVKKLTSYDYTITNSDLCDKFIEEWQKEINRGVKQYNKHKENLDAKDKDTWMQWINYLNSPTDIESLPVDFTAKFKEIKNSEHKLIKRFMENYDWQKDFMTITEIDEELKPEEIPDES